MIYDHNTTPPAPLRDSGSAVIDGRWVAWSASTPDASLASLGLYRPGTDDPIPEGHRVVSQERVIRDGRSVLVRVTEPAPVVEPQPDQFPNGVETPSVLFPHSLAHDWELVVIDGTPAVIQVSASPRKNKAERDALKAAKKVKVDKIKADLPTLLASDKQKDTTAALRMVAELLNLV